MKEINERKILVWFELGPNDELVVTPVSRRVQEITEVLTQRPEQVPINSNYSEEWLNKLPQGVRELYNDGMSIQTLVEERFYWRSVRYCILGETF